MCGIVCACESLEAGRWRRPSFSKINSKALTHIRDLDRWNHAIYNHCFRFLFDSTLGGLGMGFMRKF